MHLPSLRALSALEAVVRTGTVVAAADDLGVTAGAVSKQLAQLQHEIAAPLFSAGHRLKPTPLAIELAQAVNAGLRGIEDAWIAASQAADTRVITIAANATLSMHWILPRLVDAEARMSGHPVRVSQLHTTDDWRRLAFDIAILRVPVDAPDYEQRRIGSEDLTVLASPERARDLSTRGIEAVAGETFFVARTRDGELEGWLSLAGLDGVAHTKPTPHFYIAVEAAVAGQGCIVGPPSVLRELIAQGRLAAPFPWMMSRGSTLTAVFNPQICRPKTADRLLTFLFSDFR
jgi:LysR family glycine cleavage system transcriptional activator